MSRAKSYPIPNARLNRLNLFFTSIPRYSGHMPRSLNQGLSSTSLTKQRVTLRTLFDGRSITGSRTPKFSCAAFRASSAIPSPRPRASVPRTTSILPPGMIPNDSPTPSPAASGTPMMPIFCGASARTVTTFLSSSIAHCTGADCATASLLTSSATARPAPQAGTPASPSPDHFKKSRRSIPLHYHPPLRCSKPPAATPESPRARRARITWMPLTPGITLGSYEILAPLGKGGMGEVYRARDTRLDREAAIKVLPVAFARDPERLARFEREAKALASLNHPNIATIFGLEESPEGKAIVMELVDGAPLRPPLPLDEALRVALQIAEALEAAHDRGITHRDLKPANIMVTAAGQVKVLDFGLAAVARAASASPEDSPTFTMANTEAGTIMGTAAYMSPEQAAGRSVDRRADVWSFGVVLWEMLTGKRLFAGETVSLTLADVLRTEIDFTRLPSTPPPAIRDLLRRCLAREFKHRPQATRA